MPVGTSFSRLYGGKMAVTLETMKDSEIQYAIFRHSAVGCGGRAASTVRRVETGRKELDPLVMKRSCDERDRWVARSCCPETFRRKWEFKLLPGKKKKMLIKHCNCAVEGSCVLLFSKTVRNWIWKCVLCVLEYIVKVLETCIVIPVLSRAL